MTAGSYGGCLLNFVRNCQHVLQSAVPLTTQLHAFPSPVSCGLRISGKASFQGILFSLGSCGRQRQKSSFGLLRVTWPRDSRHRGSCIRGGCLCRLDPKLGKIWWFWLCFKRFVGTEMPAALAAKQKLLRGEGNAEIFVLQPDPQTQTHCKGKLLTAAMPLTSRGK